MHIRIRERKRKCNQNWIMTAKKHIIRIVIITHDTEISNK